MDEELTVAHRSGAAAGELGVTQWWHLCGLMELPW